MAEYAAGRRVLLIFDEAQNLSQESLEELRMLTNINSGKDEVVQLVLVGQPELREMIRRPSLVQLAQRIAVSYHLKPLDAASTDAFITHRLKVVGGTGEEITAAARGPCPSGHRRRAAADQPALRHGAALCLVDGAPRGRCRHPRTGAARQHLLRRPGRRQAAAGRGGGQSPGRGGRKRPEFRTGTRCRPD